MDARVALLLSWTVFVLLTAELNWIDAAKVYTNTWAVQINGGPGEADRIAREHGFINHGHVSSTSLTLPSITVSKMLYYICCICLFGLVSLLYTAYLLDFTLLYTAMVCYSLQSLASLSLTKQVCIREPDMTRRQYSLFFSGLLKSGLLPFLVA